MKKMLVALCLLVFALPSFADDFILSSVEDAKNQKIVSEVGFRLLNANKIPYRMVFRVKHSKDVNAYATHSNRQIVIYDTLVRYAQSDDEIAGVLAHEISHAVDSYNGICRGYFSFAGNLLNSKKYEYKADKRAVDYMVKAGYNPLALIVTMNRFFPQERYDWSSTHPLSSRRLAEIYQYVYLKYPQYLVQNEYKDNIYYQNFLLTSKDNRKKLEQKVNNNSARKVNYL